jgi:D-lactate dehydrogenase
MGPGAYRIMQELKALFDPDGILNPDVIITHDKLLHIRNLKPIPSANTLIDKCIECGFCEVMCPSRAITLTRASALSPTAKWQRWSKAARTRPGWMRCVKATSLPVMKPVPPVACANPPARWASTPARSPASCASRISAIPAGRWPIPWPATTAPPPRAHVLALRALQTVQSVAGNAATGVLMRSLRRVVGRRIPYWTPYFPRAASKLRLDGGKRGERKVVYLPSCLTRTFAPAKRSRISAR